MAEHRGSEGMTMSDALHAAIGRRVPGVIHDAATPLATVALRAELLLGKCLAEAGPDAERRANALRTIVEEARRCARILEALRSFARDDVASAESIALASVVAEARHVVDYLLRRKAATIELDAGLEALSLTVSGRRLRQVVLGLLSDAVESCARGTTIRVWGQRNADGSVTLSVTRPRDAEPGPDWACASLAAEAWGGIARGSDHASVTVPAAQPQTPGA